MSFSFNLDQIELSKVKHQDKVMKQFIVKFINEKNMKIQGGQFQYFNFNKILSKCPSISSQELSLRRNYKPGIIKDITHLSLPNLVSLNLAMNNISDFSALLLMNAPNLKKLDLSQNRIRNLRCLKRLSFCLQNLDISGNRILTLKDIQQVRFGQCIQLLKLELCIRQAIIDNNLLPLFKVEAKDMKNLIIRERIGLKSQSIRQIMNKRFKSLKIETLIK